MWIQEYFDASIFSMKSLAVSSGTFLIHFLFVPKKERRREKERRASVHLHCVPLLNPRSLCIQVEGGILIPG